MLRVAVEDDARAELGLSLDEICREGARRMLAAALELEVQAYVVAWRPVRTCTFLGGGGSGPSSDHRVTDPTKALVAAPCVCSCIGTRLIKVANSR